MNQNPNLESVRQSLLSYDMRVKKEAALSAVIAKWLEIKNLNKSISEEDKTNTELKDIREQIRKYEASGISETLTEKQKYISQNKAIDDYIAKKNEQIEKISNMMSTLDSNQLNCPEIENAEVKLIMEKDSADYNDRRKLIIDTIALINKDTDNLKNNIKTSSWKKIWKVLKNSIEMFVYLYRNKGLILTN